MTNPKVKFCPRCGTKLRTAKLQGHFKRCRAPRMSTKAEEFHEISINLGWTDQYNEPPLIRTAIFS